VITEFQGQYRFLSNFWEQPVFYQHPYMQSAIWWPSAEHAFQASKTQLPTQARWVLDADSPGQAKRLGRKLALRPDWEQVKKRVMFSVLAAKFARDPGVTSGSLGAQLVATAPQILIEGNRWGDDYWGAVPAAWAPHPGALSWTAEDGSLLWGHNYLGRLLMAVRDILE
jgi:ribA/ribD-fused uncharacterized protein